MRKEVTFMKKRIFAFSALVILVLAISAQAIEPRESVQRPRLTFSGTTAFCSVNCLGDKDSDQVEATLTLYQGTTYVDSWSGSGKGYVSLSGSCGVTSGKSYKLVLTYSINGSSKPSVSTAATCP